MDDRRTISLALCRGEQRQVLVEAGSMVLVIAGPVGVRSPLSSLAENCVAEEVVLAAESVQIIPCGGWIGLSASAGGQVVLIPPDRISLWRQVGLCLDSFFAAIKPGQANCR